MIKWLLILITAAVLAVLGSTVPLGKRTFFGHIRAIWHSDEAQDLKDGVNQDVVPKAKAAAHELGEKAAPAVDRLERGVKAGVRAARHGDDDATAPVLDAGVR